MALAKELGYESWGAAQQVVLVLVERRRKALLPQELTHGHPLFISLGARWVCESGLPIPILLRWKSGLCFHHIRPALLNHRNHSDVSVDFTEVFREPPPAPCQQRIHLLVVTSGGIFHHFLCCIWHCSLPVAAPSVRRVADSYQ